METRREFGIVGLGKIGGNIARAALEKKMRVVGFEKESVPSELAHAGLEVIDGIGKFQETLAAPRAVFLYVPAGAVVDQVLDELCDCLAAGDLIVDGGNSYWGDSIRRFRRLKDQGIHFVDLGTSGGIAGARAGACFMAGGAPDAVALVEPILTRLAAQDGYVHAGPPGAGHFTKLVHNGIEFGMLQAIAEGIDLILHYPTPLPVPDVLRCWRNGSVIRSWLIDLMEQAYRQHGGLESIPPVIEDTGEVNWLVDDAMRLEVPIPVISASVMQLLASRNIDRNTARAIAAIRHGFGGHPFGRDQAIAKERREGRIGGFVDPSGGNEPTTGDRPP